MTSTDEEDDIKKTSDICSHINLISSIQYQENELSKLATLLKSEKDREKYIKVIEMSKIIQLKLDDLQEEKKKRINNKTRINSFGQTFNKKNSMWSLNNNQPELLYSRCSSSTSSYTTTDNSTIATNRTSSSYYNNNQNSEMILPDTLSRYNTFSTGHTIRVVDRMTSMQFKQHHTIHDNITFNSRRRSTDFIDQNKLEKSIACVKPNSIRRKSMIITNNKQKEEEDDLSDEEEEFVTQTPIHVAVRRDASLFKIEKSSYIKESLNSSVTIAHSSSSSGSSPSPPASSSYITPLPAPTTIPIAPKIRSTTRQSLDNQPIEKKRVSFSDDKRKKKETIGLLTPPDSPQSQNHQFDKLEIVNSESFLDLDNYPQMIHVQKKTHQSLKGLLKRTYQLNQYTITKTNSITLPYSTRGELLYKTINSITGRSKYLLKIMIVSLDKHTIENQKRFGFTFWWQSQYNYSQKNEDEDAKFALAPDSLVKEALITWIKSQNCNDGGGVRRSTNSSRTLLPALSQCDEILRDGRKLYVVYDSSLFQF